MVLDSARDDCFATCLPPACPALAAVDEAERLCAPGGSGCVEVSRCVTAAALFDTPVGDCGFFSIDLGAGMLDAPAVEEKVPPEYGSRVLLAKVGLAYDGMPVPLLSLALGLYRRCVPPTLFRALLGDLLGVAGDAGVLGGLSSGWTGAASWPVVCE